ncbi:MAG TPA: metallopeptidase TldD-related protein [Polyangiaceae bacterium]|nr:metallopeptidase TldD-related protein [Polyangiaceae bacterium]
MADQSVESLMALAVGLVERARQGGADVAEVVARAGSELSVRVRLGETELVEEAGHRAVGMRVMKGKRVALTSTSDLTATGLDRFIADALELADLSQEDPFAGPADPQELAQGPFADLSLFDPAMGELDAAQAIAMARKAEDAARKADPRITNSEGATVSRTAGSVALALSSGFRGGYRGSFASVHVVPLAEDEGGKKRRGSYYSAKRFLEDLEDAEEVGKEAARRTLRKLGPRKVATCEAPVVFDREAARSIIGSFAGCATGGAIWRKSSYLAGREGTEVASPLITLVDDPHLVRGPGSRPFDGEGLKSRKNTLVERGVLKMYLCDSYSGRKLGRPSTANASRGGGGGVGISTTNFICQAGDSTSEAIIAKTERGLYVTEMMGFGFNAITGDFSRGAAGFWIENGELTYPVSEVTISLNLDQLLKRIDLVGNDLDWKSSVVAPTFRVSSMTIAGT